MFIPITEVKLQYVSKHVLMASPHKAIQELIAISNNTIRVIKSVGLQRQALIRLIEEKCYLLKAIGVANEKDLIASPNMVNVRLLLCISGLELLLSQSFSEVVSLTTSGSEDAIDH